MRYVIATAVVCALAARPSFGQTAAIPTPLTYGQALDVAMSRNLGLAAARRQRAIREAGVQAARQIPNPEVNLELTQDLPHQVVTFGLPLEIGGRRARRIDVANEELTLADVDVRAGIRDVRREVRRTRPPG
jgi:outer membrane protein TolC